jgi:hypothetical protein
MTTQRAYTPPHKSLIFNPTKIGARPASSLACRNAAREGVMQMAITFMAVVAGLIFSIAVALLAEEVIFRQVFRLFFSQQTAALKTERKR